jgi:hypothetical protein
VVWIEKSNTPKVRSVSDPQRVLLIHPGIEKEPTLQGFSKFPQELRDQIWEQAALDPGTVAVRSKMESDRSTTFTPCFPGPRQACTESRNIAKELNIGSSLPSLPLSGHPTEVFYYNPEDSIL